MVILTLKQAAELLGYKNKETLRKKAKAGYVPAFFDGRWKFIEADLDNYVHNNYTSNQVNVLGEKQWQSIREKKSIGQTLQSKDDEYAFLLKLPIKKKL